MDKKVDDYLEQGIYGAKQTNPGERKQFLGTLRERVILALTKGQAMKHKGMAELEQEMKNHPNAKLLFNGNISSRFFKEYKQLANKQKIKYTTILNRDAVTDLGLVLASRQAVEKENIYLNGMNEEEIEEKDAEQDGGLSSFFKNIFNKD